MRRRPRRATVRSASPATAATASRETSTSTAAATTGRLWLEEAHGKRRLGLFSYARRVTCEMFVDYCFIRIEEVLHKGPMFHRVQFCGVFKHRPWNLPFVTSQMPMLHLPCWLQHPHPGVSHLMTLSQHVEGLSKTFNILRILAGS